MKMSVTRALVELKKLNSAIEKAIQDGLFVSVVVGQNESQKVYAGHATVEDTKKTIQASFDRVESLIKNRERIKAAIVYSNAVTKVTVLKRVMSVAEAIELKSTVQFRKDLLLGMKTQLTRATSTVESLNNKLDAEIQSMLSVVYGNDKGKVDPDVFNNVVKPQHKQKQASMLDSCNIRGKIEELEKEIIEIESELDFLLSESNARTEIEVEI